MKLGELVAYLKADKKDLSKGLVEAQIEMHEAGRKGAEGFTKGADGRLRDARGRFVKAGSELGDALTNGIGDERHRSKIRMVADALGQLLGAGFRTVEKQANNVGTVVSNAGSSLWNLVPAIAAVAAVATFAGPAVGAFGGALAALPALAAGGAAAIGVVALGLTGIADRFKKANAGGGAYVDRAYQVAQAERRLRDAQRQALAAQLDINRAREAAVKRMADLNRSMANARLDERAAVDAVEDAEKDLQAARERGTPEQIERAQLAYDQAAQSLDDIRARLGEMSAEQQRNAQQGVEGSDEVTAAYDRQRQAVESVTDAEHALKEARRSGAGGGGGGQELTKIAPAAEKLVSVLKSLKPAWDDLRLSVQQKLLAGVGDVVDRLADRAIPGLKSKLGDTATTLNRIIKTFGSEATKPKFVSNIGTALDSVNRLIDKLGQKASGPLVDALGRLAGAAGPFLDALGDDVGGIIDDFSEWIKTADESGDLQKFMEQAGEFLGQVVDLGKNASGILGTIFGILFDHDSKPGDNPLESLNKALEDLQAWLDDPANQKKVEDWIARAEMFAKGILKIADAIGVALVWLYDMETQTDKLISGVVKKVEGGGDKIKGWWNGFTGWLRGLPQQVKSATAGMWDGIGDAFRSALNWVIDRWNGITIKLPEIDILGQHFGGGKIDMPHINRLAQGGIVPATRGGQLSIVGEGGEDEAVAPLSKLAGMIRDAVREALDAGMTGVLELTLDLGEGIREVVRINLREHNRQTRRRVAAARG